MQLKKNLLIVIGVILLAGVVGKIYMDHQNTKEQKAEEEKLEAERMSVVALKETFADIKSVEFEWSEYTKMTGFYDMFVKMTNINGEFVKFDYMYTTNRPKEIGGWGVIDKEKVQKNGKTKDKVHVIYTNGDEEEL